MRHYYPATVSLPIPSSARFGALGIKFWISLGREGTWNTLLHLSKAPKQSQTQMSGKLRRKSKEKFSALNFEDE